MFYELKDWADKSYRVRLPEGTKEVVGVIVSGDEILVYPVYCDPNGDRRIQDYFEGSFCKTWRDGEWVDKDDYQVIDI